MCERVLGGPGLGYKLRRWTGVPAGAGTPRSIHSSAVFAKQSSEEVRVEGVPKTSSTADRRVVVEWGPNEKSQLCVNSSRFVMGADEFTDSHNIWLRDHCRCSECFHPVTKQRLLDTFDVSGLNIPIVSPPVITCEFVNCEPSFPPDPS